MAQPLWKKTWARLVMVPVAALLLAVTAQVAWTDWCLDHCRPRASADAVVVFTGDMDRIRAAVRLTRETSARYLLVSREQRRLVEGIVRSEGGIEGAQLFVDDHYAATTDGNARYVAPLLRGLGAREVLLVTDWYHLPRALFLTRLYLAFSGIHVDPVAAGGVPGHPWKSPALQSEGFKFWGSLLRVILHPLGVKNWPPNASSLKAG